MAWVPNGGGAGVTNSVVGGGGSFMAYPQPPTGPNANVTPTVPENWGQFGPTNITISNGTGTFFVIANPGRSSNS